MPEQKSWHWEIKPETTWLGASFKELYSYKDLLLRLTRKEFLGSYQQTLLGPFWVLLQPLLTVITYVLVFNTVIGIKTGNIPPLLFNLIGITLWNLFSELFLSTSYTFTQNAAIFSKVYFPRLIAPFSLLLLSFLRFGIQMLLLFAVLAYFYIRGVVDFNAIRLLLSLPVIIITAGIAFGSGLIFSIITVKYKDLFGLLQLIIRLLMFVCPIFYSLAMVPQNVKWLVNINPLSSQFELFRFAFLGNGTVSIPQILFSTVFMILMMFFGILIFNKWSDKLMDVV